MNIPKIRTWAGAKGLLGATGEEKEYAERVLALCDYAEELEVNEKKNNGDLLTENAKLTIAFRKLVEAGENHIYYVRKTDLPLIIRRAQQAAEKKWDKTLAEAKASLTESEAK